MRWIQVLRLFIEHGADTHAQRLLASRKLPFDCPDFGLLLRLLSGKADIKRLALSRRSMHCRFRQTSALLPKHKSRPLEGSSFLLFEGSV